MTGAAHGDRFWSDRVSEALGSPVVWRVLGGRAPRLPGLEIDGCFLQALSRLATTDYGVLCVRTADARRTTLRNYDQDTDPHLWHAVQLVGANFAQIRTGNCVFSSADWLSFLTTNKFPPDERLRGALAGLNP